MIEAGFFVALGVAGDISWGAGHEQALNVLDGRKRSGLGSHPRFLRGLVPFINETFDVDFTERVVSILVEACDRDRAGGYHRAAVGLTLLFEIFDHLVESCRRNTPRHPAVTVIGCAPARSRCAAAVPD